MEQSFEGTFFGKKTSLELPPKNSGSPPSPEARLGGGGEAKVFEADLGESFLQKVSPDELFPTLH
jgi:hypothetical protein